MERLTETGKVFTFPKTDPAENTYLERVQKRLAAYEDTGLTPEQIYSLCEMDRRAKMADLLRLEEYQALGTIDELSALVEAKAQRKAYRLDGFYCNICAKKHLRVVEVGGIYLTRAEAEAAIGGGEDE